MKIARVEALPVILPRDLDAARGTAGTPTALEGSNPYRWSKDYPALYSTRIETALVKVTLDDGRYGWGESQAPLAPQVPCAIVEHLLRHVLEGEAFDGTVAAIEAFWDRMYATMRVRGHTGSFMLDAMAGVDIALWDLAGKIAGVPVCRLLSDAPKSTVPAYLSGLGGTMENARGFDTVKLYFESDWGALLAQADALIAQGKQVAIDALWHAPLDRVAELDQREILWLECPLVPEDIEGHLTLAARLRTPLALGESYRGVHELRPLLPTVRYLQPDLGRCGMTGSRRIANLGLEVVPHLSIAMGPQVAAAVHFAAGIGNCHLCEYNPRVLEIANRYLTSPMVVEDAAWRVPTARGLGIEMDVSALIQT